MGMAMRGREKHHSMQIQDFEFKKDNSGKRYIYYRYGNTKTNPSGLNFKPKKNSGRLYETGDDRCPVKVFRDLISHRPPSMQTSGPLYLAVVDHPKTSIWFKKSPMGLSTMVKRMKMSCPALKSSTKKLTNHAIRKTAVRKLRENGFQKSEIKNITGHSTEQGLDAYDSGDDDELMEMSMALLRDETATKLPNFQPAPESESPSPLVRSTSSVARVPEPSGTWTNYFAEMQKKQQEISRLLTHPNFMPSFGLLPPSFDEQSSSSSHSRHSRPTQQQQHYHLAPCTINY